MWIGIVFVIVFILGFAFGLAMPFILFRFPFKKENIETNNLTNNADKIMNEWLNGGD